MMKTTDQTTQRFPDGPRMILYIAAAAALGLLNCMTAKVGENGKTAEPGKKMGASIPDPAFFMLPVYLIIEREEEAKLEDWMLDPAHFAIPGYLITETEEETKLEDWMLDPACFAIPEYLIPIREEEPELEDWMLVPASRPSLITQGPGRIP